MTSESMSNFQPGPGPEVSEPSPTVGSCRPGHVEKGSHIAIIGAGVGGLALAHGLTSAGHPVTVFERDPGPDGREQGYRISLNAMGVAALRELLPEPRFAALSDVDVAGVGEEFAFATAGMRPLLRLRADAGARTVRRAALRRHLSRGIPIRWGGHVAGIDEDPSGVTLRLAGGDTVRAAMVVGADGAGSSVREALRSTGAAVPEVVDMGIISIGGHVDRTGGWDEALPLNLAGGVQYFGPAGWSLFVSFCEREDRTPTVLWGLSRRAGDGGAGEPGAAMALRGWHPALRRLVAGTAPPDLIAPISIRSSRLPRRSAADRPTMSAHGRITLLGDAAHLMPPQRGLGGNSALEDARVLTGALAAGGPIVDAVAAFEREMLGRARRAVEQSEESAQMFHFRNPVAVAARSTVLRGAGLAARIRAGRR
ncbi:NAD(P)/FAD-dependent oxidoreductase [Actinoplanes sp. NPDC026623]|uniref:FAD-dependent oxidoreductase n=1 Tax=Actinoplanes sp. NPDC026623 TaxID=3155610 RepID=UPI003400DAF3